MKKQTAVSMDEAVFEQIKETNNCPNRNKPERLEWLKDAGFGLFIHWTVDSQLGCVISHSLVGASDDYISRYYHDLPQTFCPDKWDADRLARLAKTAGIQYAVFTTKHHNGFCMWDTHTTPFNIMNTPYKQDIVRSYVDAFRKYGISVGFYFSPEDFYFLYTHGLPITRNPVDPYPPEIMAEYRTYLRAQMEELLTAYGPVDLMFFDGGEMMKDVNGENLQDLCKNLAWDLQPDLLITRGAIKTPEQSLPGVGFSETWEACLTMSSAWGYQPTNEIFKTGKHLIRMLVNTRAMGGSLLLNVGPDYDGHIPQQQESLLRELALWTFINREAVVGVRPWSIVREDNLYLLTDKSEKTLYVVVLDGKEWKRGERREFVIKSAKATDVSRCSVLGASGELTEYRPDMDTRSKLKQQSDGLHVSVMNCQRIYCGIEWPNPLVLRITDVEKAYVPMAVYSCPEVEQEHENVYLCAHIGTLGSFDKARVSFEWRVYPGFSMASYDDDWIQTSSVEVSCPSDVRIPLSGLISGVTYQYRAVISNDMNRMQGEQYLFVRA